MIRTALLILTAWLGLAALAPAMAADRTGPADAAISVDRNLVLAQLAPDRALTAGRPATPAEPHAAPGFFQRAYSWILTQQQRLNRELANAVKELKAAGSFAAAAVLGFIGFSYGVLHAAGPGHGKAIISSYVLANERTVRRGIMLSFLSAFIQALSAIVLVGVLAIALNATSIEMRAAEGWIETISWAFVAAVGAWLLYSQVRQLFKRRTPGPDASAHAAHAHAHAHVHAGHGHDHHKHDHHHHGHGPGCGCAHHDHHDHAHTAKADIPNPAAAASHGHGRDHHHDRSHDHDHDHACCGHAHMPDPRQLDGDLSWSKALAIAFSVGIRPCTGAILVLVFALSQGLLWAGVFATFAMALGTAITVSILAALAVGSREFAIRLGGGDDRWATRVSTAAGLTGATLVFVMGSVFFLGSLHPQAPF